MKIIKVVIDGCGQCPHYVMAGNPFHCHIKLKDILMEDLPIPKWCPLPDSMTRSENENTNNISTD